MTQEIKTVFVGGKNPFLSLQQPLVDDEDKAVDELKRFGKEVLNNRNLRDAFCITKQGAVKKIQAWVKLGFVQECGIKNGACVFQVTAKAKEAMIK